MCLDLRQLRISKQQRYFMATYGWLGVKRLILLFSGPTDNIRVTIVILIGVCSYQSREHFSDRQTCRRYAMHLLTTLSGNYKVAYFLLFFERAHLA